MRRIDAMTLSADRRWPAATLVAAPVATFFATVFAGFAARLAGVSSATFPISYFTPDHPP
jgi:hypothetical protein